MPLFSASDSTFVRAVSRLNYANPFLQERIDLEREALGDQFMQEGDSYWSLTRDQSTRRRTNLVKIMERALITARQVREKLLKGQAASDQELLWYDDLVLYVLFYELLDDWGKRAVQSSNREQADQRLWKHFARQFDYWLRLPGQELPSVDQSVQIFELFHQIYRAFFNIFECVIGQSTPAAMLRARIWQSIFTHELRRYRRSLYRTLNQVTTLITGPSGSGKELVAQAVGLSRYIPFDVQQGKFVANPTQGYSAINISAFSKSLVESELFGHAKGAFTDAGVARAGWLESSGEYGAILLDEVGELDPATQVKLLRVLQNRQYQRIGETKIREFRGKIIAATNRDLRKEIESGNFREDLYYRLCADVIETPSLAAQVRDNPEVLASLAQHIARRLAPEEHESIAADVIQWLQKNLPSGYHWPGNIRELEQCVRNVMICGSYMPANAIQNDAAMPSAGSSISAEARDLSAQIDALSLTADELLQQYCRMAYRRTKSFQKAAKLLQLDRRTVRAKADQVDSQDGAGPPV